ncbi:hypothetical protein BJX64DRAFT_282336 [Aspergillus heterothallicus]
MKILCLHPWGASAEIFEKQMSLICAMIGESHDYVFLDGPVSCGPAKEIPPNLPGPFYNWYNGLSSLQVRDAHDLGASIALSILYNHEICHPDRPPPFRFAIFFCAVLSISPDPMFNADIVAKYSRYYKQVKHDEASEKDKATMEELERGVLRGVFLQDDNRAATTQKLSRLKNHRAILLLPGQKAALVKELFALVRQLVDNGAENDHAARTQWNTRGGIEGFPRVYHPLVNRQRISIPTARLCSKGLTRVVEFEGEHKVPHRMNDIQAVLKAVEWAIRMAQMR